MNRVYFSGLNSLRFFAAATVMICHIELFKKVWGFKNIWLHPLVERSGSLGVDFFFALSGFLISYLLFEEEKVTKTIAIKDFLLRRVFRIWPVYYFVVLMGFFIVPLIPFWQMPTESATLHENFGAKLFFYMTIFPNVAASFLHKIPYANPAWSVGVEEQFYIIWPLLMKYSKNKLNTILGVITFFIGLKFVIMLIMKLFPTLSFLPNLKELIVCTRMECMAIGGLGAYWVYHKQENILKWIFKPLVLPLSIIAIPLIMLFVSGKLQDGMHILFAILSVLIIINISCNPNVPFSLENKITNYLGKVSYGIYMYHVFIIGLSFAILRQFPLFVPNTIAWNIVLYILVYGLTILGASLSYEYLEKRFIKMKKRFTKIESGDIIKD
jgi:peptidoglycan/LPS O-acetylase OafA/YrhL